MKLGSRRILIVDPDNETTQELSSIFIDEGYDVEISGGVKEAAERISNVKFDCVIMDVNLPEMEGYKAVPILKAIDINGKDIKVRNYWGYTTNQFSYIKTDDNRLKRPVFPFPHQPSINKRFYKERLKDYILFLKNKSM